MVSFYQILKYTFLGDKETSPIRYTVLSSGSIVVTNLIVICLSFITDESEEVGEGDTEGHVTYVISADVHFTSSKMTRYCDCRQTS